MGEQEHKDLTVAFFKWMMSEASVFRDEVMFKWAGERTRIHCRIFSDRETMVNGVLELFIDVDLFALVPDATPTFHQEYEKNENRMGWTPSMLFSPRRLADVGPQTEGSLRLTDMAVRELGIKLLW